MQAKLKVHACMQVLLPSLYECSQVLHPNAYACRPNSRLA